MWKRLLAVGLVAGLASGMLISVVHHHTTTPLLIHAEKFEYAFHDQAPSTRPVPVQSAAAILKRTALTFLTTTILAIGFGLLLSGCFAIARVVGVGGSVNGRRGVLWGLAGFAVFGLAPALGVPPEVPGTAGAGSAAASVVIYSWWLMTIICSAVGLSWLVLGNGPWWRTCGIVVLMIPHVIGVSPSPSTEGVVPAGIAGHFVATSLVVGAVFWAMLGWMTGTLYQRWVELGGTDGGGAEAQ